ncbi:uncharacterized protein ACIBXB_016864 isoform 4-T13 [Morphnus guianensis]
MLKMVLFLHLSGFFPSLWSRRRASRAIKTGCVGLEICLVLIAGMEVRWTKKLAVRDVSTFFSLEDRSPLCLADEMPRVWEKPLRGEQSWRHVAASSTTWS